MTTYATDAGFLKEQEDARIWESLNAENKEREEVFKHLKKALESLKNCFSEIENAYNESEGLIDHIGGYLIDVEDLYDDFNRDVEQWKKGAGLNG